jgi:hypothetical protein
LKIRDFDHEGRDGGASLPAASDAQSPLFRKSRILDKDASPNLAQSSPELRPIATQVFAEIGNA